MTPSLLTLLRKVDTPTVCNAIEVAQGKRGFDGFSRGTMLCSAPSEPAIVGYARTAKIAAVKPPSEAPEVIRERRMSYYKYMAEGPAPSVAVIEDVDFPNCIGAYWGEINTTVHKGFGMSGALTNGVMRDLGDLPQGFPVVAGSVGPSHGFVHVRAVDTPVSIFGLSVNPGDLIHADQHGALVIPEDVVDQLEDAIQKLLSTERIVLDAAAQPGFDFNAFQSAWEKFEKSRV
ncbi:RraA family protein [Ruegeria arenilitoris]|uniref:RraA family protein n=1 Tax=Ruegeria arenilitoris TaxID=1173585 RepID=UPI00147E98D1|nr:RraA family protein [Ruegeria arenilitoris]